MHDFKDWFDHLGITPFILAAGQHPQLNRARIIEGIIIGTIPTLLIGGLLLYTAHEVLGTKVEAQEKAITKMEITIHSRLGKIEHNQEKLSDDITKLKIEQARTKQ